MAAIIRYGMVGGGMKALIGEVHRKALKFDNRVELVAGCFSSHADRNAEVGVEYQKDYHGEGPVLYARSVEPAQEIKDVVQF